MARGFGLGMGTGLIEGVQVGHGIKMGNAANERAERTMGMQEQRHGAYMDARQREAQEHDYQLEVRNAASQASRFHQAMYDAKGNIKKNPDWAIVTDIGNKMGVFRDFFSSNPEVDPDNPLLEVRPVMTEEGEKITFRLNRKDGGVGVLQQNRTTEKDDPLVTLSREELLGEMTDVFAAYGIKPPTDPHAWDREKMELEQENKLELEGKKADKESRNKNLTDDVEALLSEERTNALTGETEYVLEPGETERFLHFWKKERPEIEDQREAVVTFKEAKKLNSMSAAEILEILKSDPDNQKYISSLLTDEKRKEVQGYLNGNAKTYPERGMKAIPSHTPQGMQ